MDSNIHLSIAIVVSDTGTVPVNILLPTRGIVKQGTAW